MLLSSHGSQFAGPDGGFLLLRLSVASPADLTDPSVAERLMHQVSRHQESGGEREVLGDAGKDLQDTEELLLY